MMQNSLPRLFDGIASTLLDVVLPELTSEFARHQTLAAVELLRNIATRTTWSDETARNEAAAIVEAITTQSEDGPAIMVRLQALTDAELSRTRSGMFSKQSPGDTP